MNRTRNKIKQKIEECLCSKHWDKKGDIRNLNAIRVSNTNVEKYSLFH